MKYDIRQIPVQKIKEEIIGVISWRALCMLLAIPYKAHIINKLKYVCSENQIDYSHFMGMGHNKGKTGRKSNIQDYLSNKKKISSDRLKKYLIEEKIKEHKCEKCLNERWLEEIIPLELHHKDGNNKNNYLENLEVLCPNCHSFTEHYRSRKATKEAVIRVTDEEMQKAIESTFNIHQALKKLGMSGYGANYQRISVLITEKNIRFKEKPVCQKINSNPHWRSQPKPSQRKTNRPSREILEKLITEQSFREIGKIYEVSDNSIRKWCKQENIPLPNYPFGYWRRRATGMSHKEALNPAPKADKPANRTFPLEIVKEIKIKLANGESIKKLSEEYNRSYGCIKSIKYGRTFSCVKLE
jgi:Zn finger protein HypA/HybF involved in hydrogenase expression